MTYSTEKIARKFKKMAKSTFDYRSARKFKRLYESNFGNKSFQEEFNDLIPDLQ